MGAGSFLNAQGEGILAVYGEDVLGEEGFPVMTIVPDDVSPSILRHTLDPIQVCMHEVSIYSACSLVTTNSEHHQLTEHLFFNEAVDWSSASVSAITLSIPPNAVRLKLVYSHFFNFTVTEKLKQVHYSRSLSLSLMYCYVVFRQVLSN